ncbi:MAG TPA: hypothetical protein VLT16_16570, partial [Candidatus Limnocylindrales bacterium]|nr:hypothetical protein [Candidatus Limnocylindrales bacterium]
MSASQSFAGSSETPDGMLAHCVGRVTAKGRVAGFSLVETAVGLFILLVIMAAIFSQINQITEASSSEASKMDMTQEAREFIDQTVRDLHMAGY